MDYRKLMTRAMKLVAAVVVSVLASASVFEHQIPSVSWSRGIGEPLAHPGVTKVPGNIDDGYWQGAPIGGFGAGAARAPEAPPPVSLLVKLQAALAARGTDGRARIVRDLQKLQNEWHRNFTDEPCIEQAPA